MSRTILDWLDRGRAAQAAVDDLLTPEQQDREQAADGTYRVRCTQCGQSVSNPLPVPVIVRAFVRCPECLATEGAAEAAADGPD